MTTLMDGYPKAFSYYGRLKKVRQHLEQNISASISLETAANIAGLEKKYFSAFFHSKTGIRFRDWVTHTRVTQAMSELRAEDVSITNVAFAVGFRDLRTFERAFKKCTGMTARDYKAMVSPDPVLTE